MILLSSGLVFITGGYSSTTGFTCLYNETSDTYSILTNNTYEQYSVDLIVLPNGQVFLFLFI